MRNNSSADVYEFLRLGASSGSGCATSLRKSSLHLHATVDTLRGGAPVDDWVLDVEHAWRSLLPVEIAQLWACDAHIARIVLGADGIPLDIGRSKRTATTEQRRALAARDRII